MTNSLLTLNGAAIIDACFYGIFIICLLYIVYSQMNHLVMAIYSFVQRYRDNRRSRHSDLQMILHSRHTIPISTIVYGTQENNPAATISSVDAALAQRYPTFEVVVVLQPTDNLLQTTLGKKYHLRRTTHFFGKILQTRPVHAVYRSKLYANLVVLVKEKAQTFSDKWDQLNCGLNVAKYRYLCPVEAGTLLSPLTLLKLVQPALFDPKSVIGVSAATSIRSAHQDQPKSNLWQLWQRLEYIRGTLVQRLGHSHRRGLFGGIGRIWSASSIHLWRKDILQQIGGFRAGGTFDLSLRLHQHCSDKGIVYRLERVAEILSWKRPFNTLNAYLIKRRQDGYELHEALEANRKMIFTRRYGVIGCLALPFIWLEQKVGLWLELATWILIPCAALFGSIPWSAFLLLATLMIGNTVFVSLLALWLDDQESRGNRVADILTMTVASIFESIGFQQCRLYLRLLGSR